jgi:putative endonuclease
MDAFGKFREIVLSPVGAAEGAEAGRWWLGVLPDDGRRRARRSVLAEGSGLGTYQTGLFGEQVVADRLREHGWEVLAHRARTRWGEIDLVARKGDMIVFGEVKTTSRGNRHMAEIVNERVQHRLRKAAVAWMACNERLQRGVQQYRFDVFLVYREGDGGVDRIDHIADAF